MAGPALHVRLLGDFLVTVNGEPIPRARWRHQRARQLVQWLSLTPTGRLLRDQVIDTLWPDLPGDAGAANLRKAAHLVRRVLGLHDAVVLSGGEVRFAPDASLTVDARLFEAAATAALRSGDAAACTAAAALYEGDLLPDTRDEEWATTARTHLRGQYMGLLRASAQWERLAHEDPTDEAAHRALIERELSLGNRASAVRWYAHLESGLRQALGIAPSADLQRAYKAGVAVGRAGPSPFVGRRPELTRIATWLQTPLDRRPGALFVTGDGGLGKTTLCREMRAITSQVGLRVVAATGQEYGLPYGCTVALAERLLLEDRRILDRIGDAARTTLAALTPLAEPAAASPGPISRHQVAGAFRRVLLAASDAAPILVQIDDAHLLDDADIDLLLTLAVTGRPVFVVLAYRPVSIDSRLGRGAARLLQRSQAVGVDLQPLSDAEAALLVGAVADGLTAAETTSIVRSAAGNPLVATELARCARPGTSGTLPANTRDTLLVRLCDVAPATQRRLEVLALLGDDIEARTALAVCEEDGGPGLSALDAAMACGVLVVSGAGYRFRHELVREALVSNLAPHRQIEAHRTLARCLRDTAAPPALVARHWLAGDRADYAVPLLVAAAEGALKVGAFGDALHLLTPVLARPDRHPEALRIRAEALDGRGERDAVAAYEEAASLAPAAVADDLRAKGALAQIKMGDPAGALARLATLSPKSPDGKLAEALAYCGAAAMGVSPPEPGTRRVAAARRLALDTGDRAAVVIASWAQAAVAHARGELPRSVWTDLYDTQHVPHLAVRVFDGQLCITQRLLYGSRPYPDVIAFASALAAEADRLGARRGHAFGVTLRGEARLLSGDIEGAEADLTRGAALHRDIGAATGEAFSLQRLAEVALARDDRPRAVTLLDEALDIARQTDIGFHLLDRIYGTRIVLGDTADAALSALLDAEEAVRGPFETCPGCRITLEVPAAIAAARAGQLDLAETHAASCEYLARVVMQLPAWDAAMDEVRGHLSQARGEAAPAVAQHFMAAARRFADAGQPLDARRCEALARS